MAEKINWSFVVQALGGPSVSGQGILQNDAYDKIAVTVPDNATQLVNLVPSGSVNLLVVNPSKASDKLTYKVGSSDIKLDGPLVLIGTGAVGLLGGATSLSFTNKTGGDVSIEILIGRDATP